MQRKRLGNSDLDITTLGFGAWAINRERVRQIRAADAALGRHPPPEDRRISG